MSFFKKFQIFLAGASTLVLGVFLLHAPQEMVENAGAWSELFDEIGVGLIVLGVLFVLVPFAARARSLVGLAVNGPIAVFLFSHAASGYNHTWWEFAALGGLGLITGSFALYCLVSLFTGEDPYGGIGTADIDQPKETDKEREYDADLF